MESRLKQAHVRTKKPADESPTMRMPYERDESDDSQTQGSPRAPIKQAYKDIESGQMDTDCRDLRGVENVAQDKKGSGVCSQPADYAHDQHKK